MTVIPYFSYFQNLVPCNFSLLLKCKMVLEHWDLMVSPSYKQHCGSNLPSFKQFTAWNSSKLALLLGSLCKVRRQPLWRGQHWCEDEYCRNGEINLVHKLFGCKMYVKLQFYCLCCMVLKLRWFQTFAMFWMSYAFFWVILRRPNFICRHFRTLCSIFIGR